MAQVSFSRCYLCSLLALMFLRSSSSSQESCLGSYTVSKGTSLHSRSFEDGAEFLGASLVNSSQLCLSQCCAAERCNLALLEEERDSEGRMSCLLIDCLPGQKPLCTLISRPGYEASSRSVAVRKIVDPTAIPPVNCLCPSKTGPCRASFPRWYYNVTDKICKEFTYGGCLANGNNFKSEQDCLKNCNGATASINSVPVSSRSILSLKDCSKQCSVNEFKCTDGCCVSRDLLCDGTTQCFDKSDDEYCKAVSASYTRLTEHLESSTPDNERCYAPRKVGSCRAAFPRWYFDPKSQACKSFTYGGCKGNKNNYETENKCLDACTGQKEVIPEPQKLQDTAADEVYCFAPAVTGKCRASFPRWYYAPETQSCKQFTYGGCGGNKNNYDSEAECLARCSGKMDNWKQNNNGNFDKHHRPELRHHASAISMVILLAICVLILLGGVIYFIIKLAKTDHVVSYRHAPPGEDKETLIGPVQNL
ncbi:actinia tenebrosa protease inhibitors-like isoform X2 [Heterodontus francisci]|uniref:actinia tenebrosa protease inhibitors-like isoform X2 n=1 Tax=Heterodontus francisci TaxID=7792 RepID=UPI00355B7594